MTQSITVSTINSRITAANSAVVFVKYHALVQHMQTANMRDACDVCHV